MFSKEKRPTASLIGTSPLHNLGAEVWTGWVNKPLEFSTVTGYKINTQKSLAFLYTNNEISEKEVKESIPFTIATKRIKHLGINLPKETKELYSETYETRTKESRQHRERFHIPGLEESILCK